MTAKIFLDYLHNLNREMIKQNRNILLFLDNAASHSFVELSNIKLQFLPANTTSVLQPLDAGIIPAFKINYRKYVLEDLLVKMEDCDNVSELSKSITLLDAINFAYKAISMLPKL